MQTDDTSNETVEQLDMIAARIAKKRRLAHITRGDLAYEAGVTIEVVERIEQGRPVAHDDLLAVLHRMEELRAAEISVPGPRTEPATISIATA